MTKIVMKFRYGFKNIIGKTFSRWLVIEYAGFDFSGPRQQRKHKWVCHCECGNKRIVQHESLLNGHSQSCGCLHSDVIKRSSFIHGKWGSLAYVSWYCMIQRCTNPKNSHYSYYGGRGIIICERWLKFENFFADMGERKSKKYSLDRWPNNDGNYEPGNCRWATKKQQMNNTRWNKKSSM